MSNIINTTMKRIELKTHRLFVNENKEFLTKKLKKEIELRND